MVLRSTWSRLEASELAGLTRTAVSQPRLSSPPIRSNNPNDSSIRVLALTEPLPTCRIDERLSRLPRRVAVMKPAPNTTGGA